MQALSAKDSADAQLCSSNRHANRDDEFVALGCRTLGEPSEEFVLRLQAKVCTEPRNTEPEWMQECVHPSEYTNLLGQMASYLGFEETEHPVLAYTLRKYDNLIGIRSEDSNYDAETESLDTDTTESETEDEQEVSPQASTVPPQTEPGPSNQGLASRLRTILAGISENQPTTASPPVATPPPTATFVTENRPVSRPLVVLEYIQTRLDGRYVQTAPRELLNYLFNFQKRKGSQRVDLEKCTKCTPSKHKVIFDATTLFTKPEASPDSGFRNFRDSVRTISASTVVLDPDDTGASFQATNLRELVENRQRNISRKTVHDMFTCHIRFKSVIFCPPGGGKTYFAYRMRSMGCNILDSAACNTWKLPVRNGMFDATDYLVVTNRLEYAINAPNVLFVMPCKEIYKKREKVKGRTFPQYERLLGFIQKFVTKNSTSHKLLMTDKHLANLHIQLEYVQPSQFNHTNTLKYLQSLRWEWTGGEFTQY